MTTARDPRATKATARSNGRVAAALFALTFGMVGLAYASVPFYDWFCRTTGYGGTPSVASLPADRIIDRSFEVRFDSNVFSGLDWSFRPETPSIRVRAGEVATVLYRIENRSDRETRGIAAFNVTPDLAGGYFAKLACFCFTEQTLKPGEVLEAPVTFYVDPAIDADRNLTSLTAITLSYTFFAADKPAGRASSAALGATAPTVQN